MRGICKDCRRCTCIQPQFTTKVCFQTLAPKHCMHAPIAVVGFTSQAPLEQTLVTKANVEWLYEVSNDRRDGSVNMDAMWSRLLRLADGRLVKTPAVTALWTAIMLRLVIGRHSMLERGKHSIHHPWQIVHMTSSSKPVVPGKFIDGDCCQFAKPFPASDDTLLVTFTNNLVQCRAKALRNMVYAFFLLDGTCIAVDV